MALDAQAINFFSKLAPGLMDLALGWSVPFIEGNASRGRFGNGEQRESLSTLGQGVALTFRTSGGPYREITNLRFPTASRLVITSSFRKD